MNKPRSKLVKNFAFVMAALIQAASAGAAVKQSNHLDEIAPAETAAAKPADAKLATLVDAAWSDPTQADMAEIWRSFLAEADFDSAMDAIDVADAIDGEGEDFSASCREHQLALEHAVRASFVSVFMHQKALQCAQATDNQRAADRHEALLGALLKAAFVDGRGKHKFLPIRILFERDADALAEIAGLKVLGGQYHAGEPGTLRYMPLSLQTIDEASDSERELWFDMIDVLMTLMRDDPDAKYYSTRRATVNEILRSEAAAGNYYALPALASVSMQEDPTKQTIASVLPKMREAIDAGVAYAAVPFAQLCIVASDADCMSEAIDALLPLLEDHQAQALVVAAAAYSLGLGVQREEAAAEALLAKADARFGVANTRAKFAQLLFAANSESMISGARSVAERQSKLVSNPRNAEAIRAAKAAAEAGSGVGMVLMAISDLDDKKNMAHWMNQAAAQGIPAAMHATALLQIERGETVAALASWREAARLDDPNAQQAMADAYENGLYGLKVDKKQAQLFRLAAANGGNVTAARQLAFMATYGPEGTRDGAEAVQWLLGCNMSGEVACALFMANLIGKGWNNLDADPKMAIAIFDELAALGIAGAKAAAAVLRIDGHEGVDKRESALATLIGAAKSGDVHAQFELFNVLRTGRGGVAKDQKVAVGWLEKCAAANHGDCQYALSGAYRIGGGVRKNHARAISLLEPLAKHNAAAQNDLAWLLCTSDKPALRDPRKGLSVVDQALMAQGQGGTQRQWGTLDTRAACLAAAGDYAAAVETQRDAISLSQQDGDRQPDAEVLERAKARLKLYRKGKPYIEP